MHRKKFFSDTAKSQCPLLFRSRAIVHNFLFSLHKRWQPRIYSERNSPCLLCYIKPEMKKNRTESGEEMPKHNTRMVLACSNPETAFYFYFLHPAFPSSDRMFSETEFCSGKEDYPQKGTPTRLLPQLHAYSTRRGAGDPFADYICLGTGDIFRSCTSGGIGFRVSEKMSMCL